MCQKVLTKSIQKETITQNVIQNFAIIIINNLFLLFHKKIKLISNYKIKTLLKGLGRASSIIGSRIQSYRKLIL